MPTHAQEILQRAARTIHAGKKRMTVADLIIAAKRQAENEKRRNSQMYKTWFANKKVERMLDAENNEPLRSAPLVQFREFPNRSRKLCDISPYASSSEDETSGNESETDTEGAFPGRGGVKVEIKRDPEQHRLREMELEEGRRRLAAARGRRKMQPDVDANQADGDDEAPEFCVSKVISVRVALARDFACPWHSHTGTRQEDRCLAYWQVPAGADAGLPWQGARAQRSAAPPPMSSARAASMDQGPSLQLQEMLLAARRDRPGGGDDQLSLVPTQSTNEGMRVRVLQELFDLYLPKGGYY